MLKLSLVGILGFGLTLTGAAHGSSVQQTIQKSVLRAAGAVPDVAAGGGYDPAHGEKINALIAPEDLVSCMQSVCGPAKTNWSFYSVNEAREKPNNELKAVLPLSTIQELTEIFETRTDADMTQWLRAQKMIQEGKALKIPSGLRTFFGFVIATKEFGDATAGDASYLTVDPVSFVFKVDQEKYKAILEKIPASKRSSMKAIIDAVILPMFDGVPYADFVNPTMTTFLKRMHPKLSYAEALKKQAGKVLADIAMIRQHVGSLADSIVTDYELEVVKKAFAQGLSEKMDEQVCLEAFGKLATFVNVFDPKVRPALEVFSVDENKIYSDFKNSSFMENKKAEISGINLNYEASIMVANCRLKLQQSLPNSTSALRLRKFEKVSEEVLSVSRIVAKRMVAPHRASWVDSELDKIKFVHQPTAEERLNQVNSAIRKMRNQAKLSSQLAKSMSDEELLALTVLSSISNSTTLRRDLVEESDLKKVCDNLPTSVVSDSTIPQTGNISVSWFSVNYPEVGVAILGHEIGHIMSHKIRLLPESDNTAFTKTLNCVANRNPFVPQPRPIKVTENTVWSEEDFADHFSAEVMNELRRQGSPLARDAKNMGCGLVENNLSAYYTQSNSLNPSTTAIHSKGVLRLLMMGEDQGTLTPQCGAILKKIQSPYQAPRCQ